MLKVSVSLLPVAVAGILQTDSGLEAGSERMPCALLPPSLAGWTVTSAPAWALTPLPPMGHSCLSSPPSPSGLHAAHPRGWSCRPLWLCACTGSGRRWTAVVADFIQKLRSREEGADLAWWNKPFPTLELDFRWDRFGSGASGIWLILCLGHHRSSQRCLRGVERTLNKLAAQVHPGGTR